MNIPFNKPYSTGQELDYIQQANASANLSGNGPFTAKCQNWLERTTHCEKALLTHSCTAALEMAAILINVQPGDEIIVPSYTFVSTANAFVLRGAVPVFVDIRADTLNIDEAKIEAAITDKTKAIIPVHYAGVACEMDTIMAIADKYKLFVIEDAAQGILSTYKNQPLGSIGHMGCLSFHATKNIISGEGGALLINDASFIERAEIIWEKGTNRKQFLDGVTEKYTWIDIGSSYLPAEFTVAFLWAQLEQAKEITKKRLVLWNEYQQGFEKLEQEGLLRRPIIPTNINHNAHLYYLLLNSPEDRVNFESYMKENKIGVCGHYKPLHNSPGGMKFGRVSGEMKNIDLYDCLVRLPLWIGLESDIHRVIECVSQFLYDTKPNRKGVFNG